MSLWSNAFFSFSGEQNQKPDRVQLKNQEGEPECGFWSAKSATSC